MLNNIEFVEFKDKFITYTPKLVSKYVTINQQECAAITSFLNANSNVTTIDFTKNSLDHVCSAMIVEAIINNHNINQISITCNVINDATVIALVSGLKPHINKITSLDLHNNKITDVGIMAIAEFLERNMTITELNLTGNSCSNETFSVLINTITQHNSFKNLAIDYVHEAERVSLIEELLQHNKYLVVNTIGLSIDSKIYTLVRQHQQNYDRLINKFVDTVNLLAKADSNDVEALIVIIKQAFSAMDIADYLAYNKIFVNDEQFAAALQNCPALNLDRGKTASATFLNYALQVKNQIFIERFRPDGKLEILNYPIPKDTISEIMAYLPFDAELVKLFEVITTDMSLVGECNNYSN